MTKRRRVISTHLKLKGRLSRWGIRGEEFPIGRNKKTVSDKQMSETDLEKQSD